MKNRSRYDILYAILKLLEQKDSISQTRLFQNACVTQKQGKELLDVLLTNKLLEHTTERPLIDHCIRIKDNDNNNMSFIKITSKGHKFIHDFDKLRGLFTKHE